MTEIRYTPAELREDVDRVAKILRGIPEEEQDEIRGIAFKIGTLGQRHIGGKEREYHHKHKQEFEEAY